MLKKRLKTDIIILIWLLLTSVWNIFIIPLTHIGNVTTYSYVGLIIFWMLTLKREILDPYVQRRLQLSGFLFLLLFIFRFIRYNLAPDGSALDYYMWYCYYIPIIVTPLISLTLSLQIGKKNPYRLARPVLYTSGCILLLLILTNNLHGLVIRIWTENGKLHSASGPVQYVIIFWYFVLQFLSLIILLKKCRISAARKYWWLPLVTGFLATVCWIVYYAGGGNSPHIGPYSLYNVQEVYLFGFLGVWESCILIGLIPSKSLIEERDWIREGIIRSVKDKMDMIDRTFSGIWEKNEPEFREGLVRICCLAAFVKRRANLELIADEEGFLSVTELSLSIRESFEYYSLAGISVGYEETGSAEVPALLLVCAYELFDRVISAGPINACYVKVLVNGNSSNIDFKMTVDTDMDAGAAQDIYSGSLIDKNLLDILGAEIVLSDQDDTVRFELSTSFNVKRSGRNAFRLKAFAGERASYGLSGLASFLCLEKEALNEKTRIHDSLGRCLLMTKRYLVSNGDVDKTLLFAEWSRSITEMNKGGKESRTGVDKAEKYALCLRQAEAMGVNVTVTGPLDLDKVTAPVVDTAITVHITNILRHTSGRRADILIHKNEKNYDIILSGDKSGENDAPADTAPPRETGGLLNLRLSVEAIGGQMEVSPDYNIHLILPR